MSYSGTSFAVSLAIGSPTNVVEQVTIPTTTPDETLKKVIAKLLEWKVDTIGIGSFGPVDLNRASSTYGYITSTPKLAWQNTPIYSTIKKGVEEGLRKAIPVGFTTDVNAAALAELHYGGHGNDVSSLAYVTIGTGIGVGLVTNHQVVEGLMHPEAGHVKVLRHELDSFPGICPFHKSCLEGLATANACAGKLGIPISELSSVEDTHVVWDFEAYYLGQLCEILTLTMSPHVIILGGGVARRQSLFPAVRKYLLELLAGYISVDKIVNHVDEYIKPSKFNAPDSKTTSGAVGALHLALEAYKRKSE